ncbi:hypothetical protein PNOK_0313900 [Pyrrhoderma noxium]|uniref:Uncharacterized protein n=1 Tax=Pyrrhoderma noxium TaxID=2282107 RepID=A0A286ULT1_9AGAM|nr:hypothetical protein PNOK_0313900 [Pyrrhoderma noxium]
MFASLRRETFRQCSIVKVHGSLRRLSQSPWCRDRSCHAKSSSLKLHDLSALIPPEEGTEAHEELKNELEEMMRLVEAVKLVDTNAPRYYNASSAIPDGRIWPEGVGMTLSSNTRPVEFEDRLQNGEDFGAGLLNIHSLLDVALVRYRISS